MKHSNPFLHILNCSWTAHIRHEHWAINILWKPINWCETNEAHQMQLFYVKWRYNGYSEDQYSIKNRTIRLDQFELVGRVFVWWLIHLYTFSGGLGIGGNIFVMKNIYSMRCYLWSCGLLNRNGITVLGWCKWFKIGICTSSSEQYLLLFMYIQRSYSWS